LQELRDQQKRQHETQPAPADNAPAVAQPEPPRVVSPELLKLRNQVSQLTRQRDELAGAGRENERLKAQVASRATKAPLLPVTSEKPRQNSPAMTRRNTHWKVFFGPFRKGILRPGWIRWRPS
jgi:hypothetical protein